MSGVLSSAGFFNARARYLKTIMSIKSTIAAIFAAPFVLSSAAFAGPYVNLESNASYPDGDYTGATTDLAIGFEGSTSEGKVAYYIQGGPAFVHSEAADDTETEFSGKVGASVAVSDDLSVYGEVSGISNEDATGDDIVDFGGKIGAKFLF
jgi:hypothetical protein|tara:strand:+ start:58 stop:510 length:453 start_codon:yes stop_codon:yes gene_type:complete